ncbi:MAG TPA: hypothetical protein VL326_20265 [Kofleriaceae bacterium]|nr:hypothetical protein [Kofleriaceae bacterium]
MSAELTLGSWGVNLTTDGTVDWLHFGLGALGARNRKQGVTSQISDYEHLGGGVLSQEVGAGSTLSWTDGTPTANATNVPDCEIIDTANPSGDAFRITIAAGPTPRQITFYIGNWCLRTRIEAALDDGSARTPVDTSWEIQTPNGQTAIYLVDVPPAPGRSVIFTFSVDQNFCTTGDLGELWLAAVTVH